MSRIVSWMDARLYPEYDANWDDDRFREYICRYLRSEHTVLDLGAGAGIVQPMNFKNMAARVYGIDPDPRVIHNPFLDEGKIATGEEIPYPDASFDLIFADNVLEHLSEPLLVFQEINRVLKPGGVFLAKTPNRNHYMPLIARLTPHKFHQWINRLRGRATVDTFPTRYKVNTPTAVRNYATQAKLNVIDIKLIEGRPEYLRLASVSYALGFMYERLVNSSKYLAHFRILLIIILTKPQ